MCLHLGNKETTFFTTWRKLRAFSILYALCPTFVKSNTTKPSPPLSQHVALWLAYQWSFLPTQRKNYAQTFFVIFYISVFASENEMAMERLLAPVFFYLLWPRFFRFSCHFPCWFYGCYIYFSVIFKILSEFFLHDYGLLFRQNKAFFSIFQ